MDNSCTLVTSITSYGLWRKSVTESLEAFRRWLLNNDFADAQSEQLIQRAQDRLRDDKLNVAFVAEFSRGKSELINAIFFSDYKTRILPSAAGRTTMCPTELMFDPAQPPSLRLLPIETRAKAGSALDFKRFPDEWSISEINPASPDSMQEGLQQVSEVSRVHPQYARKLGFSIHSDTSSESQDDSLEVGTDGKVEIPRWRHAIINFPHPLLKQGLVILDTPGLNAIGAEPALTLSLLPSAHAVLFILAADTGVTHSDLDVWRSHLQQPEGQHKGRLVVLNKIDGLWDELKSTQEIEEEIRRQTRDCADILGLPENQIFPVSAQKGLVAKINDDEDLLERSRIVGLEQALTTHLIPAKIDIVRESTLADFDLIAHEVKRVLGARKADLTEQIGEFSSLKGKNRHVVDYMMSKVRNEKQEFEQGLQSYYAVRSVFSNLTKQLFSELTPENIKEITQLTHARMEDSTFSMGLSGAMKMFFEQSDTHLQKASKEIGELFSMMVAVYKKFSVEHGLRLGTPYAFSLLRYEKEIQRLHTWCNTNLNTPLRLLTQEKRTLTQRFFEEVAAQVSRVFEFAQRDAEVWVKTIMAPMETQVREHQLQLKRRLESIKRIHQATETLEERIEELDQMVETINSQHDSLAKVERHLRTTLDQIPGCSAVEHSSS